MAAAPSASAVRALALEYKGLNEDPVEGFRVKLVNDEDMFVWEVALFGPPDTLYQGGYFKVNINIRISAPCSFLQRRELLESATGVLPFPSGN